MPSLALDFARVPAGCWGDGEATGDGSVGPVERTVIPTGLGAVDAL
jgi:hypothetical protein